jgi:hypothetical protein
LFKTFIIIIIVILNTLDIFTQLGVPAISVPVGGQLLHGRWGVIKALWRELEDTENVYVHLCKGKLGKYLIR